MDCVYYILLAIIVISGTLILIASAIEYKQMTMRMRKLSRELSRAYERGYERGWRERDYEIYLKEKTK